MSAGMFGSLATARHPVAGAVELVFSVGNVTAAHRELTGKGVIFITEPRQATDKDWVATFGDPDGHLLTLFGPGGD